MLGKSGCAAIGFAILVGLSCAHNVSQDKATGPDGKVKGAKALTFENNEARSNGIVTYPGGDRVDWKLVELPEKKTGILDIKLQWNPPRPGLQLAFDVFDEWNTMVLQSKKASKKSKSRVRTAVLDNAKGKYFIRVYAMNRGDAGKYKLTVDFKESTGPMSIDLLKVEIPEPPKLAAVPETEATCDEFTFDVKNPACRTVCGAGAPKGWPGCAGKCPDPPDPTVEACWDKVCPSPPTSRSKACMRDVNKNFPPCDKSNPDLDNPKCNIKAAPVTGRVIKTEVQGSEVVVTIAVGSDQGVGKGWTGRVLRGDTDSAIDGGDVTVIRVGKRETVGKVRLTIDQVSANPKVKLSPP
ncbi:MAG TPA: hypothetical protein VIV11_23685 [Kofleriaceae bacterium]